MRVELDMQISAHSTPNAAHSRGGCMRFAFAIADAANAQGDDQHPGEHAGGEGHLPYPVDGVLDGGGVERPEPAGPERHAFAVALAVEAALGDLVDRRSDGGGEDAVDGEDDPCGRGSVDAEELEDAPEQQRIERRHPCGGAGVADEGVGEAIAGGQCAGDAAHLPAELEVVQHQADVVRADEGDVEQPHDQAGPEHTSGQAVIVAFGLHPRCKSSCEAGACG